MPVAIRAATRIQDMDDANVTLGVGVDEYALTYDHDTARFVLRAPAAPFAGILATGATVGATAQAQAFTNGIVGPSWKPSADSTTALQLQNAAGANVLDIDTTNARVGIGTTAPEAKLEINNGALAGEAARLTTTATYGWMNWFEGVVRRGTIGFGDAGQLLNNAIADSFAVSGLTALHLGANDDALKGITITTAGNVGIGTASPATALHVVGAATITGGIRPAANSTTALQLQNASGTSVLNVDTTNGRVGIGTSAPAEELDVVGDIGLTGNIIDRGSASADFRMGGTDGTRYLQLTTGSLGAYLRGFGGSANNLYLGSGTAGDVITILSTGLVGIGTTAPGTRLDIDAGALTMKEMTAPTGVADKAMLYTKDNGSGKTQLCVKLGDNVEIVIATQA